MKKELLEPRWPRPTRWPSRSQFIGRSNDDRYDYWVCPGGGVGIMKDGSDPATERMIDVAHRNGQISDKLMDFVWYNSSYYEAARRAYRMGIEGFEWLTDEYDARAKEKAR